MSIQEMREKRAAKVAEYKKLLDDNPGTLAGDISDKVTAIGKEITDIDKSVKAHEDLMQFESGIDKEALAQQASQENGLSVDENISHAQEEALIFSAFCRNGKDVSPTIMAMTEKVMARYRESGLINNEMETKTGSKGGFLTGKHFTGVLLEKMKEFGGMRKAGATVQSTADGNVMQWPKTDETAETGELVSQNQKAADGDLVLGEETISAYEFTSKVITVPISLLQDELVNLEEVIPRLLSTRLARGQNKYFTSGTGANQPKGIVVSSTKGAEGKAIDYDLLMDLFHSVDPAYRNLPSFGWMMNDAILKNIKKIKDGDNRPLWLPSSMREKEPASLMGKPYTINQDMDAPATGKKTLLAGAFEKYLIRDVRAVRLSRYTDSAYDLKGQVGFCAFMRSDGKWIDASPDSVKHFLQKV